jgi:hypothetical protein
MPIINERGIHMEEMWNEKVLDVVVTFIFIFMFIVGTFQIFD